MNPTLARFAAALALGSMVVGSAAVAAEQDGKLDHLDCAGVYGALSLALPYLPGVFLMFKIAPRSGHAISVHNREVKPVSKYVVRWEAERRKKLFLAAIEAGEMTLEELIDRARACDALYGHEPVPINLDDLLRRE